MTPSPITATARPRLEAPSPWSLGPSNCASAPNALAPGRFIYGVPKKNDGYQRGEFLSEVQVLTTHSSGDRCRTHPPQLHRVVCQIYLKDSIFVKRTNLDGISTRKRTETQVTITSNDNNSRAFTAVFAAVVIVGAAAIGILAQSRESVVGIAPQAGLDHWHSAISLYGCDGQLLPPTTNTDHGDGIHSHADSVIHIHPSNPSASGPNATLGSYLNASGAVLTNDSYQPGRGEPASSLLSESGGCDGAPAELQMAIWDGSDTTAQPTILTSDFSDFRFETDNQIIAIGLVREGDSLSNEIGTDLLASLQSG